MISSGEDAAAAWKGVFIGPGEIDRQRMPCAANSRATPMVIVIHRAFRRRVVHRGAGPAALRRAMLATLTMTPNLFASMCGSTACMRIERALDVELEGAFEQVVVDVEKFGAADGGARRIEQKMDAAEFVERALDHVVDRRALGHVDRGERQRLAALAR